MVEVRYCITFTHKLRIHRVPKPHHDLLPGPLFNQRNQPAFASVREYRASYHDGVVMVDTRKRCTNFTADAFKVVELQAAVAVARRTDTDQTQFRVLYCFIGVGRCAKPSFCNCRADNLLQARLYKRRSALAHRRDLRLTHVNTYD